jgi:hypothetical protein
MEWNGKVDPDGNFPMPRCRVPVCLLLSDLQLAAVGGGAVIRIVKVAVLVEDESYAARGDVDPQRFFGFSLIGTVSREWIWLEMTCMVSFRPK